MRRWLLRGAGLVCALLVSALGYLRYEGIPLHAGRKAPPPRIEATALAIGAVAPPIALVDADDRPWRSADALANGPAVLVFYRGHW